MTNIQQKPVQISIEDKNIGMDVMKDGRKT